EARAGVDQRTRSALARGGGERRERREGIRAETADRRPLSVQQRCALEEPLEADPRSAGRVSPVPSDGRQSRARAHARDVCSAADQRNRQNPRAFGATHCVEEVETVMAKHTVKKTSAALPGGGTLMLVNMIPRSLSDETNQ